MQLRRSGFHLVGELLDQIGKVGCRQIAQIRGVGAGCLLYTSDAADE